MGFKLKRFFRYIKNNPTQVWFYIVLTLFLIWCGFFAFNKVRIFWAEKQISSKTQEIAEKQSQLNSLTSSEEFKRYDLAKSLNNKEKNVYWTDTISSLIYMFDKVKSLNWTDGTSFNDFKVDMNSIKLSISTQDIKAIYASGWILDRFLWLEFVNKVNVPNYKKEWTIYQFDLDAKIKTDDTTDWK